MKHFSLLDSGPCHAYFTCTSVMWWLVSYCYYSFFARCRALSLFRHSSVVVTICVVTFSIALVEWAVFVEIRLYLFAHCKLFVPMSSFPFDLIQFKGMRLICVCVCASNFAAIASWNTSHHIISVWIECEMCGNRQRWLSLFSYRNSGIVFDFTIVFHSISSLFVPMLCHANAMRCDASAMAMSMGKL